MPVRTAMEWMPFSRAAMHILRRIADQRNSRFRVRSGLRARACSIASLARPPRVGAISPNAPKRK